MLYIMFLNPDFSVYIDFSHLQVTVISVNLKPVLH
jgi:hypothetical protein